MRDLVLRLTSRKLWLAVGGFIAAAAAGEWGAAVAILLGYIGVEGAADYKTARPGSAAVTTVTTTASADVSKPETTVTTTPLDAEPDVLGLDV